MLNTRTNKKDLNKKFYSMEKKNIHKCLNDISLMSNRSLFFFIKKTKQNKKIWKIWMKILFTFKFRSVAFIFLEYIKIHNMSLSRWWKYFAVLLSSFLMLLKRKDLNFNFCERSEKDFPFNLRSAPPLYLKKWNEKSIDQILKRINSSNLSWDKVIWTLYIFVWF